MRIILSFEVFVLLHFAQILNGDTTSRNKVVTHGDDVYTSRYAYLLGLQESMGMMDELLGYLSDAKLESKTKGEEAKKKPDEVDLTGKAKGFSYRKYAGAIRALEQVISGLCASRQFPGVIYYIMEGAEKETNDNKIYAYDTKNGRIIGAMNLDVINTDWEDVACGPCDTNGFGHCIYISDTGETGDGPVNLIYKVQEPEELTEGHELSVSEDEIEVISFESSLQNCETLMVSPRGRIFLMDEEDKSKGLYEIVENEAKHLFNVALPKRMSREGPVSGDISLDGKAFLIKFSKKVFYWYVEAEGDMERVLTNSSLSMRLPYWPEVKGKSVAWSLDGASYFTVGQGDNEPLYRYDRIDHGLSARMSGDYDDYDDETMNDDSDDYNDENNENEDRYNGFMSFPFFFG